MILHSVFFSFRADVDGQRCAKVLDDLANFSSGLDGVLSFEAGHNRDFEMKSQAYRSGFTIRFASDVALQAYAVHPTHQQLGAELCDCVIDGADGIIVFDLEVPDSAV